MVLNPMKVKDYVTLGNILGGLASMVAATEGNLDWACYWMIIAWIFDSVDGLVARLTGGGNKFGEVFDNVADLVAYSLAPSFVIYLAYHLPQAQGGAGWSIWPAAALASIPTVFGCIRFARNNVKDIIMPEFHLGLPRTVYALYIATLFTSHLFQGPWMRDPGLLVNRVMYAAATVFILATSYLVLTMRPYHAKPKRNSNTRGFVVFSVVWFLCTSALSFFLGWLLSEPRLFFDMSAINFTVYVWFQHLFIPRDKQQRIDEYVTRIAREFREEQVS